MLGYTVRQDFFQPWQGHLLPCLQATCLRRDNFWYNPKSLRLSFLPNRNEILVWYYKPTEIFFIVWLVNVFWSFCSCYLFVRIQCSVRTVSLTVAAVIGGKGPCSQFWTGPPIGGKGPLFPVWDWTPFSMYSVSLSVYTVFALLALFASFLST